MKKGIIFVTSLLGVSLPQFALAHPGDHSEAGFFHLFTSSYHIAAIVGLTALVGYFTVQGKKKEVKSERQKSKKS